MQPRLNPRLDPVQLRKRVLLFYFAAGVNLLMALWVASIGASRAPGGTVTAVTLVFIAFAGINYYMARKLGKYLSRLQQERSVQTTMGAERSDEALK
jgi:hypothetical protein